MNKLIVFIIPSILVLAGFAVKDLPIDPSTKKITWFDVVEVPGASAELLYKRFQNWNTDKSAVHFADPDSKTYIVNAKIPMKYPAPMDGLYHKGQVEYKVKLYAKEGRYKYVLTDFVHKGDRADGGPLENEQPECGKYNLTLGAWSKIKKETETEIEEVIKRIKTGMKDAPKNSATSDDW